ncbi:MAG: hypothetical protein HQM13_02065 [SAR324 cluster bacterium]|nr:hypothetical protein [SAR324 cluster bacterium]
MQSSFHIFLNKKFTIQYNNQLIVNLIIGLLVCVLQIYPSFLLYDEAPVFLRIFTAIFLTGFLFLMKATLMRGFAAGCCTSWEQQIQMKDLLLPTVLALAAFGLHGPYWFASPTFFSDEFGIMKLAVFGKIDLIIESRYEILAGFLVLHSFLLNSRMRRWFWQLINSHWPLWIGFGISILWIAGLELFPTDKHTWAIYRYPGFTKLFMGYIYGWTGLSLETFRIPSHVAGSLTAFPLYFLSRTSGSPPITAFLIASVVLLSPLVHFFNGLLYLESLWFLMMCTSLLFLKKSLENHENSSHLLLFILFANFAFYTRNVTLLLPLFVLCVWGFLWITRREYRNLKDNFRLPFAAVLALAPMIVWHALYNLHGKFNTSEALRNYNFDIEGWLSPYGWLSYWDTILTSLGQGFIVLSGIAILWGIFRCLKSNFTLLVGLTFVGYLFFMMGDVKFYLGYGRFFYMPLVGIVILLILWIGSIKNTTAVVLITVCLGFVMIGHFFRFPIDPPRVIGYSFEKFLHTEDYQKLLADISDEDSSDRTGLTGRTGLGEYTYPLIRGKKFIILENQGVDYSEQLLQEAMRQKLRFILDCLDGPMVVPNKDPALNTEGQRQGPVSPTFDHKKLPSQLKLTGTYKGSHGFECRRYEITQANSKNKS